MKRFVLAALAAALPIAAFAEEIGAVSTVHKWLSPDDKIVIEAFDDPKVPQGTRKARCREHTAGPFACLGTDTSGPAVPAAERQDSHGNQSNGRLTRTQAGESRYKVSYHSDSHRPQ